MRRSHVLWMIASLLAIVLYVGACSDISENPTQSSVINPPSQATDPPAATDPGTPSDGLGDYPFTEYIGISADSINALGAAAMNAEGGKRSNVSIAAGWQLYVSVPFYSQNDPSFKNKGLGFNYCGNSTIGRYGCHLCCISMLYAKWGYYNMNPATLNDWKVGTRSHYAFSTAGCGDLIRPAQALQYPAMSRNVRYISAGQIYYYLQRGIPVIIEVGTSFGTHFMVIFAFDGRIFWVKDPLKDAAHQNQGLYGSFISARVYGY